MTIQTKIFLLSICRDILDNKLEHDCREPYDYCSGCESARESIEELNREEVSDNVQGM